MIRIFAVATLGVSLLISTITYAGDELSPAEKDSIFKPSIEVLLARSMTTNEMSTTKGKIINLTISQPPNTLVIENHINRKIVIHIETSGNGGRSTHFPVHPSRFIKTPTIIFPSLSL